MKGATTAAAGSAGLVPAPAKGYNTRFLRGDGIWADPVSTGIGNIKYDSTTDMVMIYGSDGIWHNWQYGGLNGLNINNLSNTDWSITPNSNNVVFSSSPFSAKATTQSNTYFVTTVNGYNLSNYKTLKINGKARTHQNTDTANAYLVLRIIDATTEQAAYEYYFTGIENDKDCDINLSLNLPAFSASSKYKIQIKIKYYTSGLYGYLLANTFTFT